MGTLDANVISQVAEISGRVNGADAATGRSGGGEALDPVMAKIAKSYPRNKVCECKTPIDVPYQDGDPFHSGDSCWSHCIVRRVVGTDVTVYCFNGMQCGETITMPLAYVRHVDWPDYYAREEFKRLSRSARTSPPRWPVGTRVIANGSPGTIVALYYQEVDWPDPMHSLYQICLDDDHLIHARAEEQVRRI